MSRSARFPMLLALPVLAALLLTSSSAAAGDVEWWEGSIAGALEKAAAENKPVLVDFYTVWCGPCKMLDKNVWNEARVVELADNGFIALKVDCEKGEGIDFAKKHRIFNYPTVGFLNPDGTELDRIVGYRDADAMLAVMQDMKAGRNTTDQLMASTPPGSSDGERLLEVGSRLTDQARAAEARPYLERLLQLEGEGSQEFAIRGLLLLADLERKEGNFAGAIGYAERVISEYDDAEAEDEALGNIAYYQKKLKDWDGAVSTYRRMIERHPEDPGTLNAFAWFAATQGVALEEATQVARKAATLSDNSPGILDTLAEVYYARGLHADAITTIQMAIAQEPEDTYFQDQLAKFRKAQAAAGNGTTEVSGSDR